MIRGRLSSSPSAVLAAILLLALYASALFAPFLSPCSPDAQNREQFFAPPVRLHVRDAGGRFHLRPFVYAYTLSDSTGTTYVEDRGKKYHVLLLGKGWDYKFMGIRTSYHLLGVENGERLHLLGTDQFGRDVFSRLLHAGRISLTVGLVGILISFSLGIILGSASGYLGGVADVVLMRVAEVMMSVPALYLILALRAVFPLSLPSGITYLLVVGVLGLVGWAPLSRVVRGMVMSAREADYVKAAVAVGATRRRIITRHILPNMSGFLVVTATLAVPGYILGEVTLSFLGLGVQEPYASWGNMLASAQNVRVLTDFPWIVSPGVVIFLAVIAFNVLGDELRDALDPKRMSLKLPG